MKDKDIPETKTFGVAIKSLCLVALSVMDSTLKAEPRECQSSLGKVPKSLFYRDLSLYSLPWKRKYRTLGIVFHPKYSLRSVYNERVIVS